MQNMQSAILLAKVNCGQQNLKERKGHKMFQQPNKQKIDVKK